MWKMIFGLVIGVSCIANLCFAGDISFGEAKTAVIGTDIQEFDVKDIDGDSKPDIIYRDSEGIKYSLQSSDESNLNLEDYQYQKSVNIDNIGNPNSLSNYQIAIILDTEALISNNQMKSDCSDIRITDEDQSTILKHWVENINEVETKIWVKIPNISADSEKIIYINYGNPLATDISNGDEVFEFFDGFSGSELDSSKWSLDGKNDNGATYTFSNGILTVFDPKSDGGSAGVMDSKKNFSGEYAISMRRKVSPNSGGRYLYIINPEDQKSQVYYGLNTNDCITSDLITKDITNECGKNGVSPRTDDNEFHNFEIYYQPPISATLYINGTSVKTVNLDSTYSIETYIKLRIWTPTWKSNDATVEYDFIHIRKISTPTPTVTVQ